MTVLEQPTCFKVSSQRQGCVGYQSDFSFYACSCLSVRETASSPDRTTQLVAFYPFKQHNVYSTLHLTSHAMWSRPRHHQCHDPSARPIKPATSLSILFCSHRHYEKANQNAASQKRLHNERRCLALHLLKRTGSDLLISFSTCACRSFQTWPEVGCRSPSERRHLPPTCPAARNRRPQTRCWGFACRPRRTRSPSRRRRVPPPQPPRTRRRRPGFWRGSGRRYGHRTRWACVRERCHEWWAWGFRWAVFGSAGAHMIGAEMLKHGIRPTSSKNASTLPSSSSCSRYTSPRESTTRILPFSATTRFLAP